MSYIGTTKIGKMFLGNTEIAKAYLGTDMVFQKGGGSIPPGATPVSWLCNNTFGEYIDTGINPDNTTIVEIVYRDFLDTSGFMFGSRVASTNAAYAFSSNGGNKVRSDCMNRVYYSSTGLGSHTVRQSNASCKIDGANIAVFSPLFTGNNLNIFVFALNNGGSPSTMLKNVKICSVDIIKGGDYVLKLLPYVMNGEGVFIDSLSGTIYQNQGTGAFTWQ